MRGEGWWGVTNEKAGFLSCFSSVRLEAQRRTDAASSVWLGPGRRSEQQTGTIAGSRRAAAVLKALVPGSLAPQHCPAYIVPRTAFSFFFFFHRQHCLLIFISSIPFGQGAHVSLFSATINLSLDCLTKRDSHFQCWNSPPALDDLDDRLCTPGPDVGRLFCKAHNLVKSFVEFIYRT